MIDNNYTVEGQMSIFDLEDSDRDTWSLKTSQGPCPPASRKEQTSKSSSRKSSKSSKQMPLMCLCLKTASGQKPDSSMEWETMDSPFPWLGVFTMLNITELHKDGNDSVYWLTSTDTQQEKYYLTLNLGEKPRIPNPTYLSDILEPNANPKYNLSPKACQGILTRAERRGKQLPPILKEALENQIRYGSTATSSETSNDEESG